MEKQKSSDDNLKKHLIWGFLDLAIGLVEF